MGRFWKDFYRVTYQDWYTFSSDFEKKSEAISYAESLLDTKTENVRIAKISQEVQCGRKGKWREALQNL